MQENYVFITIIVIVFGVLYTVNRSPSINRARAKDTHYSQLIKIKDDTILAAGTELKRIRSKLWRLENGPTYNGGAGGKDNDSSLDDLVDLYDIAPSWIKRFFTKEDARKFLADNPDKVKKGLDALKTNTNKGQVPSDVVTDGV